MRSVCAIWKKIVGCLGFVLLLLSCDKFDDRSTLVFIGDSLIARWDVENFFPIYRTSNWGLGGSHIDWIEKQNGVLEGKIVVVLIGTNDVNSLPEKQLESYSSRYVDAVLGMKADRVILISILPRNCESDIPNINQQIVELNRLIADKVKDEKTIIYCNVFSKFEKNGTLNMNLSYDGIHLNQYGYEILSSEIKKYL